MKKKKKTGFSRAPEVEYFERFERQHRLVHQDLSPDAALLKLASPSSVCKHVCRTRSQDHGTHLHPHPHLHLHLHTHFHVHVVVHVGVAMLARFS